MIYVIIFLCSFFIVLMRTFLTVFRLLGPLNTPIPRKSFNVFFAILFTFYLLLQIPCLALFLYLPYLALFIHCTITLSAIYLIYLATILRFKAMHPSLGYATIFLYPSAAAGAILFYTFHYFFPNPRLLTDLPTLFLTLLAINTLPLLCAMLAPNHQPFIQSSSHTATEDLPST